MAKIHKALIAWHSMAQNGTAVVFPTCLSPTIGGRY